MRLKFWFVDRVEDIGVQPLDVPVTVLPCCRFISPQHWTTSYVVDVAQLLPQVQQRIIVRQNQTLRHMGVLIVAGNRACEKRETL